MSDAFRVRPFREGDETEVAALWLRVFPDARAANAPREDIRRKLAIPERSWPKPKRSSGRSAAPK